MSITSLLQHSRRASRQLALRSPQEIDDMLLRVAASIERNASALLEANLSDMSRMEPADPRADRLLLTEQRIADIVRDMRAVVALPSPLGRELSSVTRPNGMVIRKVSVPFGVIGVIYEARPNVTFDVFALCAKAGSATVLKGGHEAADTNSAAVDIIRRELEAMGWDPDIVTLLPNDRQATAEMLGAVGMIDVVIPRGSRRLIDFVRDTAAVPVIETGAGVCHTYVHSSAMLEKARDIVFNAKTRRVSVCNALDTLVIDSSRLGDLQAICAPLADKNVEIHADHRALEALAGAYPVDLLREATQEDMGCEWMDYKMTVVTTDGLRDAIDFIDAHTSRHSECIVAEDEAAVAAFLREVDAACVYANVSTAFTDGGQFGFGAEIGISTQKLHARGPMGLPEITTYKYLVTGDGQTRW
ncbi:glutamate-5-semialdehyde dehydrogenase [Muribaculum intestinale]|uniref:glutamate-5-semialdehyde dehydrogenase n=1 Tax=Muribaculum intestinale TaxID=1796646 RepID=UPI0025B73F7B|nr:glutamate-5-semialdehyde dehydrogenase [Muribaculum intestinale]